MIACLWFEYFLCTSTASGEWGHSLSFRNVFSQFFQTGSRVFGDDHSNGHTSTEIVQYQLSPDYDLCRLLVSGHPTPQWSSTTRLVQFHFFRVLVFLAQPDRGCVHMHFSSSGRALLVPFWFKNPILNSLIVHSSTDDDARENVRKSCLQRMLVGWLVGRPTAGADGDNRRQPFYDSWKPAGRTNGKKNSSLYLQVGKCSSLRAKAG